MVGKPMLPNTDLSLGCGFNSGASTKPNYLGVRCLPVALRPVDFLAGSFGWIRSGRTFLPVERFHSSYCSSVILPSMSSSANFRRCALLLKGISQRLPKEVLDVRRH